MKRILAALAVAVCILAPALGETTGKHGGHGGGHGGHGGGNGGHGGGSHGGNDGGGGTSGGGGASGPSVSAPSVSTPSVSTGATSGGAGDGGVEGRGTAYKVEERERVHDDARACDPFGDITFKTHGTRRQFTYGGLEFQLPTFVQCMKDKGYELSSAGRNELTNFGTR